MAMAAVGVVVGGAVAFLLPQRHDVTDFWSGAVRVSDEGEVGVMAIKMGMMTYFEPETGKSVLSGTVIRGTPNTP
jgi:large subunit ribosomal protein L3